MKPLLPTIGNRSNDLIQIASKHIRGYFPQILSITLFQRLYHGICRN